MALWPGVPGVKRPSGITKDSWATAQGNGRRGITWGAVSFVKRSQVGCTDPPMERTPEALWSAARPGAALRGTLQRLECGICRQLQREPRKGAIPPAPVTERHREGICGKVRWFGRRPQEAPACPTGRRVRGCHRRGAMCSVTPWWPGCALVLTAAPGSPRSPLPSRALVRRT